MERLRLVVLLLLLLLMLRGICKVAARSREEDRFIAVILMNEEDTVDCTVEEMEREGMYFSSCERWIDLWMNVEMDE